MCGEYPWVVGAKGQTPAFNDTATPAKSRWNGIWFLFVFHAGIPGQYVYTASRVHESILYHVDFQRIWGGKLEFLFKPFTNSVTLVLSNQISVTFTNNYNFETQYWPRMPVGPMLRGKAAALMIPLFTNTVSLPISYWSDQRAIYPFSKWHSQFSASDLQQTGWPDHDWTLNITNNLMYALIDNDTGHVLDFVNLGEFGSSLNIMQTLIIFSGSHPNVWTVSPANDTPNSPMSEGALNQIAWGWAKIWNFSIRFSGCQAVFRRQWIL